MSRIRQRLDNRHGTTTSESMVWLHLRLLRRLFELKDLESRRLVIEIAIDLNMERPSMMDTDRDHQISHRQPKLHTERRGRTMYIDQRLEQLLLLPYMRMTIGDQDHEEKFEPLLRL